MIFTHYMLTHPNCIQSQLWTSLSFPSAERAMSAQPEQLNIIVTPLPGYPFKSLRAGCLLQHRGVGWLELARPSKFNAFDAVLWEEFPKAVEALECHPDVRVVVVCGQGRHFCAGIDVGYLTTQFGSGLTSATPNNSSVSGKNASGSGSSNAGTAGPCPGSMRADMRRGILALQDCLSCLERCRWPVIAAVHGMCIGGGVDLITACDLRLAADNAKFCVKEVDLAIPADLGTLQRLPRIVGHGVAMDLALTARTVDADEALRLQLVSRVVPGGQPGVAQAALQMACALAAKPALALAGTKRVLLHSRDNPRVSDGLDYVATWNSAQLLSHDLAKALAQGAKGGHKPSDAASSMAGPGRTDMEVATRSKL